MSASYRIQTEEDVTGWRRSPGYAGFTAWIAKRSQRITGRQILEGSVSKSERITKLMQVLDVMEQWIEEVPLLPDSQRFGNRAFKSYIDIVEARLPSLLPTPEPLTTRILPLLISSHAFGHPIRLDYGSGHELSFVLSLWLMVQTRWIGRKGGGGVEDGEGNGQGVLGGEEEEDELVLHVFPRYLTLTTHLQKHYRLEPAGSHGVWGLDDFVFLPYVFGSGQMLGMDSTPSKALEEAKACSAKGQDPKDMWTLSLKRVFDFKSGPFFEHSPLLHSLSTTMPSFVKIHRGLLKMYEEEVLAKRVVVQHLFLDDITWGGEGRASDWANSDASTAHDAGAGHGRGEGEREVEARMETGDGVQTSAPWAMPPKRETGPSVIGTGTRGGSGRNGGMDIGTKAPWAR